MNFSFFFFSSRRRHTRLQGDWSSDVCSSDLLHLSEFWKRFWPNESSSRPGGCAAWLVTRRSRFVWNKRTRWNTSAGRLNTRSEERRVGEEGRSRWSPYH